MSIELLVILEVKVNNRLEEISKIQNKTYLTSKD